MKKKVLFVATVDSHIELFHLPYLKMFKDRGYEVHVATNSDKKIKYCDKKIKLPIKRSPFRFSNLKAIFALKKILKIEKYDIIHCHTPMGGVVARLAARKARRNGTRVIYTAHGFHFYEGAPVLNWILYYPVEKWLSKYTDTLITINTEDFERAKKKFHKRCSDIQYVPGVGVDEKKFGKKMSNKQKRALRGLLGLKDDDKVLICVGRLDKNKNQGFLIKAMKELVETDEKYHLLLVGPDENKGKYKKLAHRLGVSKNVHFLGFRNDVDELLQISDIAVSASKREGLGLNLVEALMCDVPVVTLNNRGHRDIFKAVGGPIGGFIIAQSIENFQAEVKNKNYCKNNDATRAFSLEKVGDIMSKIYEKNTNVINTRYPIDFVLLWVDGSDPKWVEKKQKYKSGVDILRESSRYRDWGVLKYWFRGVEKYAPWVNHIYLVTDDQRPDWLDENNPKITIVDHKDIIDKEFLPTFNSQAIEMNLHKISGLSEHFVYFNDDMFLINKVKPTDFFKDGLPVEIANINAATGMEGDQMYARTMFNNILLINRHFKKKEVLRGHILKWINLKYGSFNFRTISQMPYPYFTGYKPHHLPAPLLKTTFEKLWTLEEKTLKQTCSHKFRHPDDVNQNVFTMWQLCENNFVPGSKSKGRHLQLRKKQDIDLVARVMQHRKIKMLCINDGLSENVKMNEIFDIQSKLQKTFNMILPDRSEFECSVNSPINTSKGAHDLVSVIVPIYNVEKYLKKCIDSILSQTYSDLEIILVDDGSTDNSGIIADEYGKKYKNVKVIHKNNGGLSSARNVGINNANGSWLAFVDSDDYISEDFVAALVTRAVENGADISTCSFESFSNDGSALKKAPEWPRNILSGHEAINHMLKNKWPAYICLSIFNAELFKKNKIEFPDGREFEDIITRVKLFHFANKAVFSNDKLYHYLIRNESITGSSISKSRCDDYLLTIKEIKEFLINFEEEDDLVFLKYFEFSSLMTLLSYFARETETFVGSDIYWYRITAALKKTYLKIKFPTCRQRIKDGAKLLLSMNKNIYSIVYRKKVDKKNRRNKHEL